MKGISLRAKPKTAAPKPQAAAKKSAFGSNDSDDEQDSDDVLSKKQQQGSSKGKSSKPTGPPVKPQATLSRAQKAQLAAAESQDASVFAYDEVFDSMKSAQQAARDSVKQEDKDRKPRYVENLLQTAEQRKLDRARAEDVMTQREREKEGNAFEDKESFVTPAYLAQQEEIRKAEEAEKAKSGSGGAGMAKFYEQYLSSSVQAHQAASEAAKTQQPSTSKQEQQYDDEPVSDIHMAREAANKLNKVVQVNEDGQVVDRTELLAGGLNMAAPRPKQGPAKPGEQQLGGFAIPIAERAARERAEREQQQKEQEAEEEPHHSGLSERERHRLRKQRQSAQIEKQLLEVQKRKLEEQGEEHERQVGKVAKRNDESKIEAMKRAAAERRKAKAEQDKQADEMRQAQEAG